MTSETSGQFSFAWFENADPPSSSESKSRQHAPLSIKLRTCKTCETEKPFSGFYVNSKGSIRPSCKDCEKELERSRKRANPQLTVTRQRNWRLNFRGHALTNVAKHRAKAKGIPFDLDPNEIQRRVDAGVCELTGIPFSLDIPRAWNAPSLDQIKPGEGYTKDNVRVILYAINVMANTWGERRIMEIASAISAKRRSASERLQASLTKALKQRISLHGSPEFSLTWTEQAMPSGGPICRLAPSARRTAASGSSGAPWNTRTLDTSQRTKRYSQGGHALSLQAAWPTPTEGDSKSSGMRNLNPNCHPGTSLTDAVSPWRTPDSYPRGGPQDAEKRKAGGHQVTLQDQVFGQLPNQVAHWSTPRASDGEKGGPNMNFGAGGTPLPAQASGTAPSGGSGPTERPGALNPEFVCWLMGFPTEWAHCAASVTPSSLKSRLNSC